MRNREGSCAERRVGESTKGRLQFGLVVGIRIYLRGPNLVERMQCRELLLMFPFVEKA